MENGEKKLSPERAEACKLFDVVSRRVQSRYVRETERIGMKPGFRNIIRCLAEGYEGATQQMLVRRTRLSAPTVSVSLGRMERDGLVRRVTSDEDQRSVCVYLTEKGWAMERERRRIADEMEAEFSACLTDGEIQQLSAIMEKVWRQMFGRR
ncbi:MAG: winged helix DNA-binding protein [Oscillospiraceae bacterium]|nr:winged helix DNA-binding protein [Oscillospiraceae bacterium]